MTRVFTTTGHVAARKESPRLQVAASVPVSLFRIVLSPQFAALAREVLGLIAATMMNQNVAIAELTQLGRKGKTYASFDALDCDFASCMRLRECADCRFGHQKP